MNSKNLQELIQEYFTRYLINQKQASHHTIASYRDTFYLLLKYAQQRFNKSPVTLQLKNLDVRFISDFLNHLQTERGISIRSRNQRLAAIHSFFRYISLYAPECIELIQQVLAIPIKKYEKKVVGFLIRSEMDSILGIPDRNTWIGRRDHAIIMLMMQTGIRVSELTKLCFNDLVLKPGAYIISHGKGRKERCTPLMKQMVDILKSWIKEGNLKESDPLFPGINGGALSSDTVQYLLAKYVTVAKKKCSSLENKNISPHVLRHTAAMQMLYAGIDRSTIALWLGHESVETTQIYLEADLLTKEKILEKMMPFKMKRDRYMADDRLLSYLSSL